MAEAAKPPHSEEWTRVEDGVVTYTLVNWRVFHEVMAQDPMLPSGLIWRGQRRDWSLKPSLDREGLLRGESEEQHRRVYGAQLEKFKIAVAGRRGLNPHNLDGKPGEGENDEWWALGQQNGLKTPLLDWTESPFAALFFAFEQDSSSDVHREFEAGEESFRYVYGLMPSVLFWKHGDLEKQRLEEWRANPEPKPKPVPNNPIRTAGAIAAWQARERRRLDVPWIRIVRPHTDENVRLLSQGGLFTEAPPGRHIEGFVREHFAGETKDPPMLKVRIRDEEDWKCLMFLNRMGINHRTLFPDLHGASLFTNRFIRWPEY
jgi:hypothetical protein